MTTFESLGLRTEILRAIADQGYTEPTPIQAKSIPLVISGRDVMASAQTGTGKTAGFTLPLLQRLCEGLPTQSVEAAKADKFADKSAGSSNKPILRKNKGWQWRA